MSEYVSHTSGLGEEDLSVAVDILYEYVEFLWLDGKPLPNGVELLKPARNEFSIGLSGARNLVKDMEHISNLREIGYFKS